MKRRNSHVWDEEPDAWYIEPAWTVRRLLDVERFEGEIVDPCAGRGTVVRVARHMGFRARGFDLRERGFDLVQGGRNFLLSHDQYDNIACNPPFIIMEEFVRHAVRMSKRKTACISPIRRIAHAGEWLSELPLSCVYWMTPRPSMPPGPVLMRGDTPGGGTQDFAWLVFDRAHHGPALHRWLHRDGLLP